jgi:predicted lysophospholipase L1 biosynthesis ABC-type transport system permease subunit
MDIVGVVADVRSIDFAKEPAPFQLYQPTVQDPRRGLMLAVRVGAGSPGAIIPEIRAGIAEIDPDLVVRRLRTATNSMAEVTSSVSIVARLLTVFAVLGLLLAALGIYGAMTRMVAQRSDEIGLRMALGAQVRNVLGLVLASGARIVGIGIATGLVGAFALSRLLGSMLPSMETSSGLMGSGATVLLITVALLACYLPARRATRVDPIEALRSE